MKSARQNKIIELICSYEIDTQEELVERLKNAGFDVTQATVSRDIRSLGLIKSVGDTKKQKYAIPEKLDPVHDKRYISVLKDAIISFDHAENIIVIKTVPGMAMAVAAAFDLMDVDGIVGCIAGDDTMFCVVRNKYIINETVEQLAKKSGIW